MSSAGKMRDRYRFEQRAEDANDDRLGPWNGDDDAFTVWAETKWLKGTEAVMAQRLEGRQPVALVIRDSTQARTITTAFRAVDARSGAIFNIAGVSRSTTPGFIDVLAVSGGAAG